MSQVVAGKEPLEMQAINEHETQASLEASISAWIDAEAEIRPEDIDTPYGRKVWETYHLIGDVLRSDELAIRPSEFLYARISRAIDEEPSIVAPGGLALRRHVRVGLSGLAVAAAVATVAWIALPQLFVAHEAGTDAPVIATADPDALHDYVAAHRDIIGVGPVRQVAYDLPGDAR